MAWEIKYYNVNVEDSILAWPQKILQRYLRITNLIENQGPDLGMPFTGSLGKGLFEIRVKASEGIGRAFFCYLVKKEIIILHGFIKKTNKPPKKDLKIAIKRMKEVFEYERL